MRYLTVGVLYLIILEAEMTGSYLLQNVLDIHRIIDIDLLEVS